MFSNRFKQLFGMKRPTRFRIDFRKLLENKENEDLLQLERPFSLEEIKIVVFNLGRDKAPGPDGFPLQFFRQF